MSASQNLSDSVSAIESSEFGLHTSTPLRQKRPAKTNTHSISSSDESLNKTEIKKLKLREITSSLENSTMGDNSDSVMNSPHKTPATLDDVMKQVCENGRFLAEIRGIIHDLQVENEETKKEIKTLREKEKVLEAQVAEAKHAAKVALAQANEADQYNRRSNLRIYGIPEKTSGSADNTEDVEDHVIKLCADLKVKVTRNDIQAAHRLGRPRTTPSSAASSSGSGGGNTGSSPRGIIVQFVNRKHRDAVLSNRRMLKNTRTVVTEDLTDANYKLYQTVRNNELCDKAWTTNGKVLMKCKSGRIVTVRSAGELNDNYSLWSKPR